MIFSQIKTVFYFFDLLKRCTFFTKYHPEKIFIFRVLNCFSKVKYRNNLFNNF